MSTFKFNITKIKLGVWSLKARVQRRLPEVEMTEVEAHMATYSCLLQIIDGRLPTGSINSITTVVEVASGKGHATALINVRTSARDLSMSELQAMHKRHL